jgi:hypothetical protein
MPDSIQTMNAVSATSATSHHITRLPPWRSDTCDWHNGGSRISRCAQTACPTPCCRDCRKYGREPRLEPLRSQSRHRRGSLSACRKCKRDCPAHRLRVCGHGLTLHSHVFRRRERQAGMLKRSSTRNRSGFLEPCEQEVPEILRGLSWTCWQCAWRIRQACGWLFWPSFSPCGG